MAGTTKLSISLPAELAERVRDLAGGNVSAWVADVAAREVRRHEALVAVGEWESRHGPLEARELDEARARWLA